MGDMDQPMTAVLRKSLLSLACFLLFLAVAMFLPAGIDWWQGCLFVAVFLLQMAMAAVYLWYKNPEIFVARSEFHKGTKSWDKVALSLLLPSFMATFPIAAFDHQYQWSSVSIWGIALGYVLLNVGMLGSVWVESVNKFAEPSVRIQVERGHKVVDTGPYAIVRHPMYVASFFLFFGIPLSLGSLWALAPVAFASLVLVVRTALEDRTLQNDLTGYKEYASRVRYRLIPGVW